jgi:3-hydroxyisobutyrate dehydrogenase-like beta-hydroxyacid dehydrogenase
MTASSSEERDDGRAGTVGLVGAGRVGQWFVTKLTRKGYEPIVFDVDPEAVADAVDRGATAAEHPADVANRADVVVLSLPTREAVETVMEGDDGVLETLGDEQVVVDAGTTPPNLDVHYQRECHERGAGYVDCGLTIHGPGESGDDGEPAYTMFVGGDASDYERVRPLVETLGDTHEFFEGIGNGHVVKAAVVLRATCRAAIAAEVCEFLSNNAIDPSRVVDLLDWDVPTPYLDPPYRTNRGFDRAVHTDDGDTEERGFDVDDGGARPRLRSSSWAKDSAYAQAVARASGSHVPMLTAAYQMRLLAANYGAALVDRDLEFGDDEWHAFHLRSVYRALTRPQEEWRRLSRWTERE